MKVRTQGEVKMGRRSEKKGKRGMEGQDVGRESQGELRGEKEWEGKEKERG